MFILLLDDTVAIGIAEEILNTKLRVFCLALFIQITLTIMNLIKFMNLVPRCERVFIAPKGFRDHLSCFWKCKH